MYLTNVCGKAHASVIQGFSYDIVCDFIGEQIYVGEGFLLLPDFGDFGDFFALKHLEETHVPSPLQSASSSQ